jgi:uncharacterized damage-inducible protein DinB
LTNQQFFSQTFSSEFDRFHNVVAALPGDKLEYRHDPRSRTARQLVAHLIGHFDDLSELLEAGEIHHRIEVPFDGIEDAVAKLDRGFRETEAKLKHVTDAAWAKPGDFFIGDRSIMNAPAQALAWMLFLDAVHHRGQLSTLIRPMGGKVPGIYGPSADTQMGG